MRAKPAFVNPDIHVAEFVLGKIPQRLDLGDIRDVTGPTNSSCFIWGSLFAPGFALTFKIGKRFIDVLLTAPADNNVDAALEEFRCIAAANAFCRTGNNNSFGAGNGTGFRAGFSAGSCACLIGHGVILKQYKDVRGS